ncbi:hypothetical protein EWM64_g233 [Hericium alpestre]|uniref:EamA domain-containing protein n=1 Tax=Hericium alpestre TaxID=135208 RepID=A0A4Z0AD30_9AGAM|nr:hypothetical protein EWM64_g233 [Hericium alpestre]
MPDTPSTPPTTPPAPLDIQMESLPSRSPSEARSRDKLPLTRLQDRRDYAIGIGLLLVVVFLWTSSNFVTQDLFVGGYEKPFLITYMNTSAFSLYLIPFLIRSLWKRHFGNSDDVERRQPRDEYQPLVSEEDIPDDILPTVRRRSRGGRDDELKCTTAQSPRNLYVPFEGPKLHVIPLPPLTIRETAKLASIFCFFWFVANWSLNASLDYTSVASATILSCMSGFFTLAIGRIFKVETLTLGKIAAVVVSFGGVVLVSLSDSQPTVPAAAEPPTAPQGTMPLLGDFLALLSAAFYALYVTLLKVRIRSESRIDMQLFFGFVGLFNILSCWPVGVLLHLTGVERFEIPSTGKIVAGVLINMFITLSSDYIYVIAMLKTTPLVVTIGLSLTMPLAVVGDLWLHHPVKAQVIFGALLVIGSFVVVGLEDSRKPRDDVIVIEQGDEENS